jgi:hypothetical protein
MSIGMNDLFLQITKNLIIIVLKIICYWNIQFFDIINSASDTSSGFTPINSFGKENNYCIGLSLLKKVALN